MATQALGSRGCSQERLCADPFMCTDVAKVAHNRPQLHRAYNQAKALITSLATSSISSALSLTKGRGISSSESTALSPTRTSLPWVKAWSAWRTCNMCACACAHAHAHACVRVLAVWAAGAVGVKPVAWCCFPRGAQAALPWLLGVDGHRRRRRVLSRKPAPCGSGACGCDWAVSWQTSLSSSSSVVARFLNAFQDLQASMTTSLLPVAAFFAAGAAAGAASFALRLGGIHICGLAPTAKLP